MCKMAKKLCTPFCDPEKTCPKHHDLLLAALNCSDRKDKNASASFEHFQSTVKAFLKKGWKLNDDIPDPVRNYRFPLLHWVSVLGKCKAMEWMIRFGFNVTVCTPVTQESALHRCIVCFHHLNVHIRRLGDKIKRTVHLLKDCLLLRDSAMQTPLHVAAEKMLTGNKSDYYSLWLEAMVAKANDMPGKTADILNARDHLGNTALHYLAQNEIGFVPLRAIVGAGGDITIANKKKLTPVDIATNNGSTRMIKILNFVGEEKLQPNSRYDKDVYTADSPPESPGNLQKNEDENTVHPSHDANNENFCDLSMGTDTATLECLEDSCFHSSSSGAEDVNSDVIKDVSSSACSEPCLPITDAFIDVTNDATPGTLNSVAAAPTDNVHPHDERAPVSCPQENVNSEPGDDSLSERDAPGTPCHLGATCVQSECHSANIHMPVIYPYSGVVHIKQEKLSPCERCHQESIDEISSSSELTSDRGNSVLSLLRGAGLLQNLAQIAERTRNEDEHVLTDKLEMVKETNSQLEMGEKEIDEKNDRISSLMAELDVLKQQVQTKLDDRERLLLKRKHLNEECSSLQKKLHCCDSLLKVVPKVNLEGSNV